MLAPINSSIRRYFCGITQHKLNQWSHCARQNVKRSDCAHLPIEAKQLAQRDELQQTVNNSPVEATKLFFNLGVTIERAIQSSNWYPQ